jgi:acetyl-CoA synthetase
MFAAWNAEATVVVDRSERFSAPRVVELLERLRVTTMCAPPTGWRKLIAEGPTPTSLHLREAVSAGEQLSPELSARVQRMFGVPVRDGYGQTETAHLIGFSPGQTIKPGSFGRPMPGFDLELRDSVDGTGAARPVLGGAPAIGEMQVVIPPGGIGMMAGYDDASGSRSLDADRRHRTGDLARCDADGHLTYIGRLDDVFKASGYRISPLEVEQALLEHPAVAEVAVVPSPDGVRGFVPKAYVALAQGWQPERDTAASILLHARAALSPYKRVRKLTFCELPKTISGKVKRGELRDLEQQCHNAVPGSAQVLAEWHDHGFVI